MLIDVAETHPPNKYENIESDVSDIINVKSTTASCQYFLEIFIVERMK